MPVSARRASPIPTRVDRSIPARTKVLVSIAFGLAVGVPVALLTQVRFGALVTWDAAAAFYLVWVWLTIWPLDATETSERVDRQDPTRAAADLLLLGAATVSLVAVGLVLASAAHASGVAQLLRVGLGLASVVLSWGVVHTVYTLRYAHLYYTGEDGGVDFNQREPPDYRDFAYLSFTIGMTFQVSDTDLQEREIRRTALHHALLSFLFGTGILATTINLVASLSSSH
ncbi:MAG: hypothetical protein QOI62_1681 [Solirubrobacteraceae bacterium]|nr:hypothetical protein [Solirubrobacteraceae bacterium]